MKHLMIDLETMDNKPTAAITAIGAVLFNPETGEMG
ncbi:3'-5' exoribonuclease domain-containing protein, partial [Klebsiella pneumoniae]